MYLWSFENGGLVLWTFSHTDVGDREIKEGIPGFADCACGVQVRPPFVSRTSPESIRSASSANRCVSSLVVRMTVPPFGDWPEVRPGALIPIIRHPGAIGGYQWRQYAHKSSWRFHRALALAASLTSMPGVCLHCPSSPEIRRHVQRIYPCSSTWAYLGTGCD